MGYNLTLQVLVGGVCPSHCPPTISATITLELNNIPAPGLLDTGNAITLACLLTLS